MARSPEQFIHDIKEQLGHDAIMGMKLAAYKKGMSNLEAEEMIARKHNPLVEEFAKKFGGH